MFVWVAYKLTTLCVCFILLFAGRVTSGSTEEILLHVQGQL